VNVGLRQKGRERARNVLDCRPERGEIADAIVTAMSDGFRASLANLLNPYGDGHSAEKIVRVLTEVSLTDSLRIKQPVPIHLIEEYEYSSR